MLESGDGEDEKDYKDGDHSAYEDKKDEKDGDDDKRNRRMRVIFLMGINAEHGAYGEEDED